MFYKEGLKMFSKPPFLDDMNLNTRTLLPGILLAIFSSLLASQILLGVDTHKFPDTDWPNWRGPNHNGIAHPGQKPPIHFSATKNVLWKAKVPGRGHGTPIVVGNKVTLMTADQKKQVQSVIAYNRSTGQQSWKTDVHSGGFMRHNKKASQANGSLSCDGDRIFFNFPNGDGAWTTALGLDDGKIIWQTRITDYVVHQGYGSTPFVYKHLLIVAADNKKAGAIAALDRTNGRVIWKNDRPRKPNYPSPVVFNIGGRDQLVLTGCDLVTSLDPLTGKKFWEFEGATTECVATTVTDGQRIFTSGGYPKNHISAVEADGSGKVTWQNNIRVYVPSMIAKDGFLYAVTDAGIAICWNSATGEQMWKGRLGGTFSASPTLVGKNIYAVNETGAFFVFKASPKVFEIVVRNQLGNAVFASPVICDSRIYQRIAFRNGGRRQEMLFCLGEK
jgi:outer membrane protein assembly factor BamB